MPVGPVLGSVGVVIWAQNRSQGFCRRIMKILGLLADSILAVIREPAFYTPLAGPFIACTKKLVSSMCSLLGDSDRHCRGGGAGEREPQGKQFRRHFRLCLVRIHGVPQVR